MIKTFPILIVALILCACSDKKDSNLNPVEQQEALFDAVKTGDCDRVKGLLSGGADVGIRDKQGQTALHQAAAKDDIALIKLLVNSGSDVNIRDKEGRTPLHYSVSKRLMKITELLLQRGADVDATDNQRRTPLDIALDGGDISTLILLREYGASKVEKSPTSMRDAILLGDISVVRKLLSAGAKINSADKDGYTPMYYAACCGDVAIAKLLIESGALIDSRDATKCTPLSVAVLSGQKDMAVFLISKGANVNEAPEPLRMTSLHSAASEQAVEIAEVLIAAGAKVNKVDCGNFTPLDYAETEEMAELLRRHGGVSGKELNEGEGE